MNSNDKQESQEEPRPVHFLDLPEADLQEWRALPQTALLVAALQQEAAGALQRCAGESQAGNLSQAAYNAGWADVAKRVGGSISERRIPRTATPAQDDTYVDPATRPSTRRTKLRPVVTP